MTEIRVYQAQDFNLVCDCLRSGTCGEEYYDSYARCMSHGQWWKAVGPPHLRHWERIKDKKVPYIIACSQEFRLDTPSHM